MWITAKRGVAWLTVFGVALLMAGCGGGGSADSPSAPAQPAGVNAAPSADAGRQQNVRVGSMVTLDGSASTDPNGDALSYAWILSGPAGSAARLNGPSSPKPSFIADVAGSYTAELVVNDGKANSSKASVTVTASVLNAAPVANAGADQSVVLGSVVTLDGSASSDADGDLLSYDWILQSRPDGSKSALVGAKSARPGFTADTVGTYQISLSVFDGKVYSATANVKVSVAVANVAPVANAGAAQNVTVGKVVTLDGSASSDPNGDSLSFQWALTSRPAGSQAALSSPTSAKPAFTADQVGIYVASLIVSDGRLTSPVATVPITAALANSAPVAKAGVAQNVQVGTLVTLDGTTSYDVDGDTLNYRWALVSKPANSTAAIAMPSSPLVTFRADAVGTYVANLVVDDGKLSSQSSTITVTAATANVPPVALAGAARNVTTGTLVTLDGSGSSDANGDTLSYQWSLSSKPAGSQAVLSGSTTVNPSFSADLAGVYVASLVVNDGQLSSSISTIPVTASASNVAPVASAGAAQTVNIGALVTLDGSGSSDANGDVLGYQWSLTSKPAGSTAVLSATNVAKPSFTADLAGVYVASLLVSDGQLSSNWSTVPITAARANTAPVANAGGAQTVLRGATVTLSGLGSSDADGDALTYSWALTTRPAGSIAALSASNVAQPSFVADVAGVYVASLVVSDGKTVSAVATVPVTAN
jgi:hypothetical protein